MAIRNGIFKVRNASTGEKDEVMLKTTIAQVDDLNKLTGATASAAGIWGLAPAPAKGSQNLPLCGDAKYKVLPVEGGGTGANTVAAAVQALLGSSAVGSSTKSIYYDGKTLKACADSIGGGGIVAQLLEQNGYVKFANGLILQWGFVAQNQGLKEVQLILPFSNTKYIVTLGQHQVSGSQTNSYIFINNVNYNLETTRFWIQTHVGIGQFWLALGV